MVGKGVESVYAHYMPGRSRIIRGGELVVLVIMVAAAAAAAAVVVMVISVSILSLCGY